MAERIVKLVMVTAGLMIVVPFVTDFWQRTVAVDARGYSAAEHPRCERCGRDYYPTELQWTKKCVICGGKITLPQQ